MHRLVLNECYSLTCSISAAEVDHRRPLNWNELSTRWKDDQDECIFNYIIIIEKRLRDSWVSYLMLEIWLLYRSNSKTTGNLPKAPNGISVMLLPYCAKGVDEMNEKLKSYLLVCNDCTIVLDAHLRPNTNTAMSTKRKNCHAE